ncbi:MAG: hypothetical protein ACWA5T_07050 [Parvularcula sp.]
MALWRKKQVQDPTSNTDPQRFSRALRRAAPSSTATATDQIAAIAARQALTTAISTISDLRATLRSLGELAASALATNDLGARGLLSERFEDIRGDLAALAETQAVSLLTPQGSEIVVPLPGNAQYVIHPARFDLEAGPFHLPVPASGFSETSDITAVLEAIDRLIASLDTVTKTFKGDLRFLNRHIEGDGQK